MDQYLNVVPGATVDVELLQYGMPISGLNGTTQLVTDPTGWVEYLDLSADIAGYGLGLRFTSGAASADSFEFIILHGQPTTLMVEVEPQDGVSGSPLNPAPAVKLTDINGNPVPNSLIKVWEIGGATISSGSEARTGANGVAVFDQLVMPDPGTGYVLEFWAQMDGILPAWSAPFDLSAGSGSVVGRYLVYNDSEFDGNNPGADASDDNAIATDKSALLPGSTATQDNVSNYGKGINAIAVDLAGTNGTVDMNDFQFRVGNSANLGQWRPAPMPEGIDVRAGAGLGGSDRVTIWWESGAISGR